MQSSGEIYLQATNINERVNEFKHVYTNQQGTGEGRDSICVVPQILKKAERYVYHFLQLKIESKFKKHRSFFASGQKEALISFHSKSSGNDFRRSLGESPREADILKSASYSEVCTSDGREFVGDSIIPVNRIKIQQKGKNIKDHCGRRGGQSRRRLNLEDREAANIKVKCKRGR